MQAFLEFSLVLICLLSFPGNIFASVYINEFSPASDPESVELYNDSDDTVDISGWSLKDASQKPKVLLGSIPPHGYFVYTQKSGWLNNTGAENLCLQNSASPSAMVDSVNFGTDDLKTPASDKCGGRYPDGGSWLSPLECTLGAPNPAPPTSTPLPPTDTPHPTATAVPTHTPHPPSRSPTPKPTLTVALPPNTPTFSVTPTTAITLTATPSAVLGITDDIPSEAPAESISPNPGNTKHVQGYTPLVLIGAGLLSALGSAGLAFFRHRWYTA